MILQYCGFNNNWCYTQANTIVWANVYVGKETRNYRKDGVRWKKLQENLNSDTERAYFHESNKAVHELIKKETNCSDNICYLIGNTKFEEMENVCVVTLQNKGKDEQTYVFVNGVYLLNDNGSTVQKIA